MTVYHFFYFDPDRFEARRAAADACDVEYCDPLWSLGTIPYFLPLLPVENLGLQLTFTWTGGEDIPDSDKSTIQVQPSVESSSNALSSHCEIMTASRDKGSHMHGLGSVYTFPNRQRLQTVPAPACKHCFEKERTELSNGSDYDVKACWYYRLPADSYASATIDMGEPEVTPAMYAVISFPTSARTGRYICFSNFVENMTTPLM